MRNQRWFWDWFFRGIKCDPGWTRLVNKWLPIHVLIGGALYWLSPVSLREAASGFLLPIAGIFAGIAFAWASSAQSVLQTQEIEALSEFLDDGYEGVVYTFQLTILVLLCVIIVWGLASLGVFDQRWPTPERPTTYTLVGVCMYALASMGVRACWQAVFGAQLLLISRYTIRRRTQPEKALRPGETTLKLDATDGKSKGRKETRSD